ncbi:hypothetical protein MAR_010025 [Mya arenaria]|uniref:Thioredoxin-like fold domain-containing protein n=1 Tax=Mya arenaria TaxID=6604 RepID=A0ABY7E3D5_MYAAR|nr:uncharacterized protein LOC128232910 [Mya arenaria]WAR03467.1 hypothetical protein MAR_010025 [Mya arenaria]
MKRKTAKSANMFRIALFVVFLGFCSGQMIIPPRPLGFVYGNGSNDAFIHLDAHFGPLCPDSKAALPNLKQVADYYGGMKLKLTLHMFPLPYHHQAYLAAVGGEVVSSLTDDNDTYMYIEEVYSNLEILSNDATSNMSSSDVMNTLGDLALACCGVDKARFLAATKIKAMETKARTAWKYSASRGIASTPTFLLNDVEVAADPTWTMAEWRQVIDPLVHGNFFKASFTSQNAGVAVWSGSCPAGTVKCEYLPEKVECCTKGEACIPNVGCRC